MRPLQDSLAVRVETGLQEPGNREQRCALVRAQEGRPGGRWLLEGQQGVSAREALRTWLVLIPSSLFHPETPPTIH